MKIGIQTFTVRKAQKRNFEAAYTPLANMGVGALEIARIDFSEANANALAALLAKL